MPKRFLNVQYEEIQARINVTDIENLSEVQDAIKAAFGEAIPALILHRQQPGAAY